MISGVLPLRSSTGALLCQCGEAVVRVVSLMLRAWLARLGVIWAADSTLFVRPCLTMFEARLRIDDEPSSVPRILAISSSMLKSPPLLHLGSLGECLGSPLSS